MGADLSISTKLHGMGTGGPKPAPTGAADRPRSRGVFELSITGRGVLRRHAGGQGGASDRGASYRGRGHVGCLPPVNTAIYDFDQGHTSCRCLLAVLSGGWEPLYNCIRFYSEKVLL